MPYYSRVRSTGLPVEEGISELAVTLGPHRVHFGVDKATLPDSDVPVYLVRCHDLYGRQSIYDDGDDEHLRFALLNWAALMTAQALQFKPDVIHVNDWQTSLIPLLLKTMFAWDDLFAETKTVLTIHNLGHQGTFSADRLWATGLAKAAHLFHQDHLSEGRLSFLLTGIMYADAVTTVSPTYAREILTAEHGVGLDPFLRARADALFGILNGIDTTIWNPATDPHLPSIYSADDLSGKDQCKEALLKLSNLPYDPSIPVYGIVSRLVWQKGFELCEQVLPHMLHNRRFQLVVLGTGESRYEHFFHALSRTFPSRVGFHRTFSEPLAHLVEAGSDFFLMPSRYEPCGLNQMFSLAYGTPPIVHSTGGLADTVQLWHPESGTGNGFIFDHFDRDALGWAIDYSLSTYGDHSVDARNRMATLRRNGMNADHGLVKMAKEYEVVYRFVCG
jgi:starch synthase